MCFSATASFSAGIVLSGIGIASLRKVQAPRQYPFATIPIIFACQQLIEGVVWLTLSNPDFVQYQRMAPYAYLIFAQAVWPMLIPFAFTLLETDKKRRQLLAWLTGAGILVAILMMYNIYSQNATAEIRDHHIHYNFNTPANFLFFPGILYFLVIIAPPFISTVEKMKWLAWSSLGAFLVTTLYFAQNLLSVWCFFAAIISVVVLRIMYIQQRATNNEQQTTNNEQQTTSNEQRTTNNQQRTTSNEQPATNN